MEKTAKFIKDIPCEGRSDGFWRLYKVDPPIHYEKNGRDCLANHIIASTAWVLGHAETYLFPANEKGEVVDWMELDGSFKGGRDHDLAIENAGYELK